MTTLRQLISPLLTCCLLSSTAVYSLDATEQPAIIDYQERFLPIVAQHGMVAGPEKLATEIGTDIMRKGGNAIDAAVATGFALAVSYPRAGNIGGGGFMLIHLADENRQTLIDYRETAPAAASRDMFLNEEGKVDKLRAYFSHQSAGVPGTVDGLLYALEKYGTMSRKEVLAPAIALAKKGMPVTFALNYEITQRAGTLKKNPAASGIFFKKDGSDYTVGELWKQSDLAWTLQQIAKHGRDGFYSGAVADRIVSDMEQNQGLITKADLKNYRTVERAPVTGKYRDFDIIATPPPSSGGIHIIQMLNILEGYDLQSMGHNSAAYLHHLAEVMKLAYADRSEYLADPDFAEVPAAGLIDKNYAQNLRKSIAANKARPSSQIFPGQPAPPESTDTTHYTVADSFGNVVSNTYTLNFSFGSHILVPGTGMLLNNEMADFAASPGKANVFGLVQGERNKIEGGKRPLSSMTPTLVLRDGQPWLATGSPGGSLIITTVLQTILNAMEFDMNVATASASPRIHHQWQPDTLRVEQGVSPDTILLLRNMGHPVALSKRTIGRTQSIMLENGWLLGATDTRRPGGWVASY